MSTPTLQNIQTKVRRITRSPSESSLTTTQLNEYIDTFMLYDLPENIRLFSLRTLLTFYTQPNVDVYETNTTNPIDPLFNFKNKYVAIHPPIYMAGVQAQFTQWRNVFYGYWPQTNKIADTQLRGNGINGFGFAGTLASVPVLQNNVIFTCLDTNGAAMILVDYPKNNVFGALGLPGQPTSSFIPYGSINYVTGAFTLTFLNATQVNAPIFAETISYKPGIPTSMLYYDNKFTLRPVPDKAYAIQVEADIRPTELINTDDVPQIEQWWQYIAYGASKKIFEDRMDLESVQMIMPEFRQQERLALRTTLVQQANERTVTIFTQGKNYGWGWGNFFGGWPY